MQGDRVLTRSQLDAALDALCALDPRMAELRADVAEPPLRTMAADLAGLVWLVNSQLISVTAARAIHGRVEQALGVIDHTTLTAAPDEVFRTAGMSRVKLKTVRALCAAVDQGLELDGLAALEDEAARKVLLAIPGIGPWTADVFLLFAHGRPDAFPGGDVAVQAAMKEAFGLEKRPDRAEAERLAEGWRPLRGVAAQLLWAYYLRNPGGRDGAPTRGKADELKETS